MTILPLFFSYYRNPAEKGKLRLEKERQKPVKLLGELREGTPFPVARIPRRRAAELHPYRAVLEFRDLAERIELGVGQHVRRRLVVGEGNEDGAARRAVIHPCVKRNAAAPRFDRDDVAGLHAELR